MGARLNERVRGPTARRRVLVVDDDADWRSFLSLSLEELGYETDEASCGEEALRRIEAGDFSVVLLDVHMPGMSGQDVARKLRGHDGLRVVFLTAAQAHEIGDVMRDGARYYLPKGARKEQLSLLLQSLEAAA